jgi:hypothetical protein
MGMSDYIFEMPDGTKIQYDRDNDKQSEKEWLESKGYSNVTEQFLSECKVYSGKIEDNR